MGTNLIYFSVGCYFRCVILTSMGLLETAQVLNITLRNIDVIYPIYHMVFVGPFQYRYCWCVGSSQNAGSSTAAGRAGCRNYGLNPNTAASHSCSPVSYNCHIDPSGQRRKKKPEEREKMGKDMKDFKKETQPHWIYSKALPLVQWRAMYSVVGHPSPYPIVEYSVLGHAVGSTELLHPASVVAVQHLLADAGAVCARTPRMILVTRCQVTFKE